MAYVICMKVTMILHFGISSLWNLIRNQIAQPIVEMLIPNFQMKFSYEIDVYNNCVSKLLHLGISTLNSLYLDPATNQITSYSQS